MFPVTYDQNEPSFWSCRMNPTGQRQVDIHSSLRVIALFLHLSSWLGKGNHVSMNRRVMKHSFDHLCVEALGRSNSFMTLKLFGIRHLANETCLMDAVSSWHNMKLHLHNMFHSIVSDMCWDIDLSDSWKFIGFLEKCGKSRKMWKIQKNGKKMSKNVIFC